MSWELHNAHARSRVLIMVSRLGHCLNDLLFRCRSGSLAADVVAVVSNHLDLQLLALSHAVPFHHLPVTPATRPRQEALILELLDQHSIDLVVLARYMQVLSDDRCAALAGRAINIHHSFLRSFRGARPYCRIPERSSYT